MTTGKDMYRQMCQKVKTWSSDQERKSGGGQEFVLPREASFFKPHKISPDDKFIINRIELIPYIISIDNHPKAKKGEAYWTRKYFRHRGLGADHKLTLVCPSTLGKPCPICEFRRELAKEKGWKDDEVSALRPQEVDIFNIIDKDEPTKGVQLFVMSYAMFGKKFKEEIDADPDNIYCVLPTKEGKTIVARFSEEKYGNNPYFECSKLDFKDRKEDIEEKLLKQAIDLDTILIIKSAQEIQTIFLGLEAASTDHNTDTEVKVETEQKEQKEQKEHKEEKHEPSRKSKPVDTEEKKEEKVSSKNTSECPFGHVFGVDTNKFDECDDCPKWDPCWEEKDNLKKK
jgi:hypothetical protein